MTLTEITPPSDEPITLEELKLALKLEHEDDDNHVENCLMAARHTLEKRYDMAFVSRSFKLTLDKWPPKLVLPIMPAGAVTSVKVSNVNATFTTLTPSTYMLSHERLLFYINPPVPGVIYGGIEIEFTAGFSEIPAHIRQAVQMLAVHFYQNRGVTGEGRALPENITMLMSSHKPVRLS